MKVRKLTFEQKEYLTGLDYDAQGTVISPVIDAVGNWFIGNEEIDQCVIDMPDWFYNLPEIDHKPVIIPLT